MKLGGRGEWNPNIDKCPQQLSHRPGSKHCSGGTAHGVTMGTVIKVDIVKEQVERGKRVNE